MVIDRELRGNATTAPGRRADGVLVHRVLDCDWLHCLEDLRVLPLKTCVDGLGGQEKAPVSGGRQWGGGWREFAVRLAGC